MFSAYHLTPFEKIKCHFDKNTKNSIHDVHISDQFMGSLKARKILINSKLQLHFDPRKIIRKSTLLIAWIYGSQQNQFVKFSEQNNVEILWLFSEKMAA